MNEFKCPTCNGRYYTKDIGIKRTTERYEEGVLHIYRAICKNCYKEEAKENENTN